METVLDLGSTPIVVDVEEVRPGDFDENDNHEQQRFEVSDSARRLADYLSAQYAAGKPWSQQMLTTGIEQGSELITALQIFCRQHRITTLDFDRVVGLCCFELSSQLRYFVRWALEVRSGLRHLVDDMYGTFCVAYLLPPNSGYRTSFDMGRLHTAVLYVRRGEKGKQQFLFRGYTSIVDENGDVTIGGAEGNAWSKDGWLCPGFYPMEAIKDPNRYRFAAASRSVANMDISKWPSARALRLNIENFPMMKLFLQMVRSLRASATAHRAHRDLRSLAQRHEVSVADLIEDPGHAFDDRSHVNELNVALTTAQEQYRDVGVPVLPEIVIGFARHQIPSIIETLVRDSNDTLLKVVPYDELATRPDRRLIMHNSPASFEGLESVLQLAGRKLHDGDVVSEMVAEGAGDDATITFCVDGQRFEDARTVSTREFFRDAEWQIVPQVVRLPRNRVDVEDLQFMSGGAPADLSAISEHYLQCGHPADYR